ncbi:ABC transporter permease, partial [Salmonella enterica]|nr:ABC transporter permease [Salmonella enterica]
MTFSETFAEYWPSMLIGLKETGIMMSISMAICLLVGLPLGLGLFLANPKVKGHQPW